MVGDDVSKVVEVLDQVLASAEHTALVTQLSPPATDSE